MARKKHKRGESEPEVQVDQIGPDKDQHKERETQLGDEASMLLEARRRAVYGFEWWNDTYQVGREDVRFAVQGDQWDLQDTLDRDDARRPYLTMNKLRKHQKQVINDIRQRRPTIQCTPGTSFSAGETFISAKGTEYALAEVYEGLIRKDEADCNAEAHYDRAHQHATEAGVGWLRVLTEYTDGGFDQHLVYKSVKDRWSVILDPMAEELCMEDAWWGFVFTAIREEEFRHRYPDAILGDFGALTPAEQFWRSEKFVTVAEYFTRDIVKADLLLLSDGRAVWRSDVETVLDEMAKAGIEVVRERKADRSKVSWRKITPWSRLVPDTVWPGSQIPLVPVFGDAIELGERTAYRSLTHDSHDEQRAHNFWMTAATERVGMSPKAPWVGTTEQFEGHPEWDDANVKNYSKLEFNSDPTMPGAPKRDIGASMPVAELQMAMSFEQSIMSTLGRYEASVGQKSNETSGVAIQKRSSQSETGSFNFQDNLARAIKQVGKISVDVIPKIFDGTTIIGMIDNQGIADSMQINRTVVDEQTRKEVLVHDIKNGGINVEVKSNKNSDSMRMEVVENLTEISRSAPTLAPLLADVIAANLDFSGAKQLSERLRRAIDPNLLSDSERKEMGLDEQGEQGPTPEQQAELAKAEADMAQAEATKAMAEAKLEEAAVKMAQVELEKRQLASGQVPGQAQGQGQGKPSVSAEEVRKIVADALAEIMAAQQA